jgi:hypothetical protein
LPVVKVAANSGASGTGAIVSGRRVAAVSVESIGCSSGSGVGAHFTVPTGILGAISATFSISTSLSATIIITGTSGSGAAVTQVLYHPTFTIGEFTDLIDFPVSLISEARALGKVVSGSGSSKSATTSPSLHDACNPSALTVGRAAYVFYTSASVYVVAVFASSTSTRAGTDTTISGARCNGAGSAFSVDGSDGGLGIVGFHPVLNGSGANGNVVVKSEVRAVIKLDVLTRATLAFQNIAGCVGGGSP